MTNPSSGVFDFTSNISGTDNVRLSEDTSTVNYIYSSGTGAYVAPDQVSSWYQSGTSPNVPNTQITSVVNSLYVTISNQQRAPFQSSGNSAPSANVPTSESSITH